MLTPQERNNRGAIIDALQGMNPHDPLVRAVICDLQQMARRAREQIAFIGDIPDFIYIPPLNDETERVALAIWAGKFTHEISLQVQSEIQSALDLPDDQSYRSSEPAWLI